MNVDGSFWEPEQYHRIEWVFANDKPLDTTNLSGYHCKLDTLVDEALDSEYKLFKNQHGKVFARYIGTNYRNGPPVKKI